MPNVQPASPPARETGGSLSTPVLARFARRAVNSTWRDVDWARALLQPHAGKTLRVEIWPLPFAGFTLQVSADGDWDDAPASDGLPADATLRVSPGMIPRWINAPDKPGAAVELDGEPALTQALRELFDVLPLAIEERLSMLIGPIAAHGVAYAMSALASWPAHATGRLGAGVAAYLTEESAALLKRGTFEAFGRDVAILAERAGRLLDGPWNAQ